MFNFVKRLIASFSEPKVPFLGVLGERASSDVPVIDQREVVAAVTAPVWIEKNPSQWRNFLAQYQYRSSACVAFTTAKIAQILFFIKTQRKIKFSPGWIYQQRSNKPDGGMWIDDVIRIAEEGIPPEEIYPSEGLDETQINNLPNDQFTKYVVDAFDIAPNWVNIPLDFDLVASTIQQTDKGIMLWFDFGQGEWFSQYIPAIKGSKLPYRHSVTAVDTTMYQGQQYLVIEDSAEVTGRFEHRKLVSRAFFKRCILARYPLYFKFDAQTVKPQYAGSTSSLQDCLRFGGFLASNIPSTGFYGTLTTDAVKKFQEKNNIQQTGTVGPVTSAKLLELFPIIK